MGTVLIKSEKRVFRRPSSFCLSLRSREANPSTRLLRLTHRPHVTLSGENGEQQGRLVSFLPTLYQNRLDPSHATKTVPHLSTLRLRGYFLNTGPWRVRLYAGVAAGRESRSCATSGAPSSWGQCPFFGRSERSEVGKASCKERATPGFR